MNLASMVQRAKDIEQAIAQLVQNHSVLTGQLAEAKHWISEMEKPAADVVEAVAEGTHLEPLVAEAAAAIASVAPADAVASEPAAS